VVLGFGVCFLGVGGPGIPLAAQLVGRRAKNKKKKQRTLFFIVAAGWRVTLFASTRNLQ